MLQKYSSEILVVSNEKPYLLLEKQISKLL